MRRIIPILFLVLFSLSAGTVRPASADGVSRASAAYARRDYLRAVSELIPLAQRGDARAQALLGFMYENGFGVPQAYDAAADYYHRAAVQGDPFGQSRLGLSYDKGHGVPQDFVLSYKWLDLAAAHVVSKRERDFYLRLRNAVASKMSSSQIEAGQQLALNWIPGRW